MYIHNTRTLISDKISLLYDFTILKEKYIKQHIEVALLLNTCHSEIQMEQKLYNVLHGSETIKELLTREKDNIKKGVDIFIQSLADFMSEYNYELKPPKLKDFYILKQIIVTFYDFNLADDDRFDILKEELKCIN